MQNGEKKIAFLTNSLIKIVKKIALRNDLHAFSFRSFEDTYLYLRNKLCIIVSNYGVLCLHVSLKNNCDSVVVFLYKD